MKNELRPPILAGEDHLPEDVLALSMLPQGKTWRLVWHDEFDGTELDRTKWDYRLHMMHQRYETWTEDAASLDGKGNLVLKVFERNGDYYTSQLQTGSNFMDRPPDGQYSPRFRWTIAKLAPAKFMHKHGYYEIRCKLPRQPGWWVAFWLQSPTIGSTLDPGRSGVQVDIMANHTRDGTISHSIHWNGYGEDHAQKNSGPIKLSESSPDDYHTFGLDWDVDRYVFYTDGEKTWQVNSPVSNCKQFIVVSAECLGYRQGAPSRELNSEKMPDYFVVDYVRVFDHVPNP